MLIQSSYLLTLIKILIGRGNSGCFAQISADPTHGMVEYQRSEAAWEEGLVLLKPSSLDPNFTSAIMKVDDYSFLRDHQNRNSIRLSSKKSFKYGLVILDLIKLPYGCSTWPAFWTVGQNWPHGGEIDIVEGVNLDSVNQMTLHTGPGCKLPAKMSKDSTGKVLHDDCDVSGLGENTGCGVVDRSTSSFGESFNAPSGGVFVMEWKPSEISIWRFNRSEIPLELFEGHDPHPSNWSIPPIARWDYDECHDLRERFSEHKIIFDITLCGDWAGSPSVYNANGLCSGSCSDAVKEPSNFKNAFWEVASVKLYQSTRV